VLRGRAASEEVELRRGDVEQCRKLARLQAGGGREVEMNRVEGVQGM
jgi:hypothetical protein